MALLRAALQSRDRLDLQDAVYKAEKANKATAGYNLRLAKEMLDLVNRELEMRTLLLDAMTARVRAPLEDTVRRCEQSLGEWAGHAEEAAVGARALVARLLQEEGVAGAIRPAWRTGRRSRATSSRRAPCSTEPSTTSRCSRERCPELRSALEKGVVWPTRR